jgi:hypothetical protein
MFFPFSKFVRQTRASRHLPGKPQPKCIYPMSDDVIEAAEQEHERVLLQLEFS